MTFDPLSSQGMLCAMKSAEQAAKQIQHLDKNNALMSDVYISGYTKWAEETFQTYMQERQAYYALEQRWSGSEFWQQRHYDTNIANVSQ